MLSKKKDKNQLTFCTTFEEQLNRKHPLYALSESIDWEKFDKAFESHYSKTMGTPAKPIRLMVGLLILKHLRNLSDESVVEQWSENSYYQFFCGEKMFVAHQPCASSELVHFRERIGAEGLELILQESLEIHKRDDDKPKQEKEMIGDTTVQENNITYPTDDKLYKAVIKKCIKIAEKEEIELRQSYRRTIKNLSYKQRFRKSKRHQAIARKADRKVKTIAGRLVREIERKISPSQMEKHYNDIEIFKRVLSQKRNDKNKVYSLHEPQTECISKGKVHKRYEFGSKVSLMIGKKSGLIYAAKNIEKNVYDAYTLPPTIEQFERINGYLPERIILDLGYRGIKEIGNIEIVTPQSGKSKTKYEKQKQRMDHRRRSSIEAKISHVKNDFRMGRNYYKGVIGDEINVILAASASNFKRWIILYKKYIKYFLSFLFNTLEYCIAGLFISTSTKNKLKMTF